MTARCYLAASNVTDPIEDYLSPALRFRLRDFGRGPLAQSRFWSFGREVRACHYALRNPIGHDVWCVCASDRIANMVVCILEAGLPVALHDDRVVVRECAEIIHGAMTREPHRWPSDIWRDVEPRIREKLALSSDLASLNGVT